MDGRGRRRRGGGFWRQWNISVILLLLNEKPSHGYELADRLAEFNLGRKGIGQMGGLYRLLSFLEEEGYITSSWETNDSGPAKKIYKTNQTGLDYLKEAATEMDVIKSKISMFQKRSKQIEEK